MYSDFSRYKRSMVIRRYDDNALYLTAPTRISYLGGFDETIHVVQLGDTLQNLASRYYQGFALPAALWWIIADFQPEPINDPTEPLTPGDVIFVPATDLVQHWLMSEDLEDEASL